MDKSPGALRLMRRRCEESHGNHSFVAGREFRGSAHDPSRYVRRGVPFPMSQDMRIKRATWTMNFVPSIWMLTKKLSPLVWSAAHA